MSVFNPPYQDFMVVCSEKLTCFLGSCAKHSLPEPGESSIGVKKTLKRPISQMHSPLSFGLYEDDN